MPRGAATRGPPNPVHHLEMELDLSDDGLTYNIDSALGT